MYIRNAELRPYFVFLNCALIVFWQTCEENRIILTTSLKSVALCCQVCSLFCVVVRFFQENASKLSKLSDDGNSSEASHEVESESSVTADSAMFPPDLFAEWQEFFSRSLFSTVLRLFLFYAGKSWVISLALSRGREGWEDGVVVAVFFLLPAFYPLISSSMSKFTFWSLILVDSYRWVTW